MSLLVLGVSRRAEPRRLYARAIRDFNAGRYQRALAGFATVLEHAALDAPHRHLAVFYRGETHARLAIAAWRSGRYADAVTHWQAACTGGTPSADWFLGYGSALAEIGAHDQAEQAAACALALRPDEPLGLALLWWGRLARGLDPGDTPERWRATGARLPGGSEQEGLGSWIRRETGVRLGRIG